MKSIEERFTAKKIIKALSRNDEYIRHTLL